ncbi:MAG: NAD(P)H-hydrate dehydratase [Armatimonadetes bacterium]|nr:NAD(P)H-hydrate dehydratase [Armatimonadota bacterium]MBX3110007.1 NAD(P)H-hydrate dehydratase [Fimbriimonadaceae bacterium]
MWIATRAECQEMDRRATEEFGIPVATLMESAGEAVLQYVSENTRPVAVVCGVGHNGGDGFVVARLLAERGDQVTVFVAAESPDRLKGEGLARFNELPAGIPIHFGEFSQLTDERWDTVVDAILGIGAEGAPRGLAKAAIEAVNSCSATRISIDVPSGIDCDTGQAAGAWVRADETILLGLAKQFVFQGNGITAMRHWSLAPIGFPTKLLTQVRGAYLTDLSEVSEQLPIRRFDSHKGENGHVLIVAGSQSMRGAAVLAAMGAVRSGAGLVTVAGIPAVCDSVACHLPECLTMALPQSGDGIAPVAAQLIRANKGKWTGAVFGPGLGQSDNVRQFLAGVWDGWDIPSVIDADALNAVCEGVSLAPAPCILTPHPGEMGRLLRTSAQDVQSNRFTAIRQACEQFGKPVVLKGAYSLAATPGHPISVNPTGNPGMAAAGMGDVLCGVLATLLAQQLDPRIAAECATFWHGHAGDLCVEEQGDFGYTASDLARKLPDARATLTPA